jgi:hypothetical protein
MGRVKKSPLVMVTWLKTLIAHPFLVKIRGAVASEDDILVDDESVAAAIQSCAVSELLENSVSAPQAKQRAGRRGVR